MKDVWRTLSLSLLLCLIVGDLPLQAQYTSVNRMAVMTGAGYISIANKNAYNYDLASAGAMSIDAWVMPTSFAAGYMTIVGNDYTTGYWFGTSPNGKLIFYPWGGTYYESSGAVVLNQWSHVAIGFNARSNTLRFYINGVLDRTVTTAQGSIGTTKTDLRIGADRYHGGPDYYWTGRVDEVRIWDAALEFNTASGLLYKIPHALVNGRYGRYLKGCWRLNGDVTDETGTGIGNTIGTGSFVHSAPFPLHYPRICAVFNNGITMTGAPIHDYFAIPGAVSTMQFTTNYTVECWVKRTTGGGASYQTLLYKGSDYFGQRTWGLQVNKSTSKLRFLPTGNPADVLESTANVPVGQWTHVAASFQQVAKSLYTAIVYVNGIPSGSKNYTTSGTPNQLDLLIGRGDPAGATSGSNTGLAGALDEVRLWSTVRSADEIADNHRREFNGPVSGLLAVYRLDGDIYDLSGNNHNGSKTLPASSDIYFLDANDLPAAPSITLVAPNGGETWNIGSTRSITWTASSLQNVRIELSRDGGLSYTELTAKTGAATGSLNWTVTAPATATARVRITTVTPTGVEDISNANFVIAEPTPTLAVDPKSLVFGMFQGGALPPPQTVHLTNVGGQTMTWMAAGGAGGWLGLLPSSGSGNVDSLQVSITSNALTVGTYTENIVFTGNMSNSGLVVPVTLRVTQVPLHSIEGRIMHGNTPLPLVPVELLGTSTYTTTTDGNGRFFLVHIPEGDYTLRPVSDYYEFTPAERSYLPLTANVTNADFTARPKQGTARIHHKEGWNLLSIPVVPTNMSPVAVFPMHIPPAYRYSASDGYEIVDKIEPGVGYWVKFPTEDSVDVIGSVVASITISVTSASGGWNMIGTAAGPTQVASLLTVPSSIIRTVYAYDPVAGYTALGLNSELRPGNGYFMKVLASGTVTINAAPFTGGPPPASLSIPSVRYQRLE